MKVFFTNLAVFVLLAFIFSGLSACTNTPNPQKGSADEQPVAESKPVGEPAPAKKSEYPPLVSTVANADLKNLDGTTFKPTDKKGKVIVLNMWATWCGPCRSEMPTLVRIQETHGKDKLEIIGLDVDDESVDDINKFAEDMHLNYTLAWADSATYAALLKISGFGGIPQSFIVDRDGNLRGVFRGANPSDVKKLEELVGKIVAEGDAETASAAPATESK
ncbi:MAG TPA: TlpA disulfide reductase family protein [Pyrinomonadaceae bacterium]|jgi:thiol-disulfide isomerase/thioredoxin|nr:TlpA disulfide reductase family protein [Pyrinomonadaceae bacterium]